MNLNFIYSVHLSRSSLSRGFFKTFSLKRKNFLAFRSKDGNLRNLYLRNFVKFFSLWYEISNRVIPFISIQKGGKKMDLINSRKHSCERNKWICLKKKKKGKKIRSVTQTNRCVETLFQKTYFAGHKIKLKKKKGKKKIGQRAKIKYSMGWNGSFSAYTRSVINLAKLQIHEPITRFNAVRRKGGKEKKEGKKASFHWATQNIVFRTFHAAPSCFKRINR